MDQIIFDMQSDRIQTERLSRIGNLNYCQCCLVSDPLEGKLYCEYCNQNQE